MIVGCVLTCALRLLPGLSQTVKRPPCLATEHATTLAGLEDDLLCVVLYGLGDHINLAIAAMIKMQQHRWTVSER